jgi:hypothetical protein
MDSAYFLELMAMVRKQTPAFAPVSGFSHIFQTAAVQRYWI